MYKRLIKRILDLFSGIVLLFLLFIPGFLIYLILRVNHRNPVFRQVRAGYLGKPITIYKFKTILEPQFCKKTVISEEERISSFGFFLRRTGLDEIPQLLSIIKGDLSLVGPRPLLVEYLPLYPEKYLKRHSIKPGLTGLAQVNGRNLLSWEQKFDYDLIYIKEVSFMLDIKILFKTVVKIFKSSKEEHTVIEKFKGICN